MTRWLTIIGMGEDGMDGLNARARRALQDAEAVVGSERLLGFLPPLKAELHLWPQPFAKAIERIMPLRGRRTVVLATGDPSNYGAARKLLDIVPFAETEIIPGLSSFSLAAARMGWALPDCDTLTLHGRAAASLEPFIQPDARLLVLTADASTAGEAARRLAARGFGGSEITVLENMGGPRERRVSFTAGAPPPEAISALNTLAIRCVAGPDARILSRVAGLPDDAFVHDGQLTKREVRAATIAALAPAPDQLLWDIGAGCGSIAIEWMRAARGAEAVAFETHPGRLGMIATNADQLGAPRLTIRPGHFPEPLPDGPRPHAVFIGGGLGSERVFETAWNALRPGGRLVANTVTLEGEARAIALHAEHGGELVRMDVSDFTRVGNKRALRPRMSVLQWRTVKP